MVLRKVSARTQCVDSRKREKLIDALLAQKTFEGRCFHLRGRAVAKVLIDEEGDAFNDFVRVPEPAADGLRHLRSDRGVSPEGVTTVANCCARRLGNIVEQDAEAE